MYSLDGSLPIQPLLWWQWPTNTGWYVRKSVCIVQFSPNNTHPNIKEKMVKSRTKKHKIFQLFWKQSLRILISAVVFANWRSYRALRKEYNPPCYDHDKTSKSKLLIIISGFKSMFITRFKFHDFSNIKLSRN